MKTKIALVALAASLALTGCDVGGSTSWPQAPVVHQPPVQQPLPKVLQVPRQAPYRAPATTGRK